VKKIGVILGGCWPLATYAVRYRRGHVSILPFAVAQMFHISSHGHHRAEQRSHADVFSPRTESFRIGRWYYQPLRMGAIHKALARTVSVCVGPRPRSSQKKVSDELRFRAAKPPGRDEAQPPASGKMMPVDGFGRHSWLIRVVYTKMPAGAVVGQQAFVRSSATNVWRDVLIRSPEHHGVQALSSDTTHSCLPSTRDVKLET
jgi:hypothetical protein